MGLMSNSALDRIFNRSHIITANWWLADDTKLGFGESNRAGIKWNTGAREFSAGNGSFQFVDPSEHVFIEVVDQGTSADIYLNNRVFLPDGAYWDSSTLTLSDGSQWNQSQLQLSTDRTDPKILFNTYGEIQWGVGYGDVMGFSADYTHITHANYSGTIGLGNRTTSIFLQTDVIYIGKGTEYRLVAVDGLSETYLNNNDLIATSGATSNFQSQIDSLATSGHTHVEIDITDLDHYNSADFTTDFATKTTTNLTEGTNLYYTQARFDSAFGAKTTTNLTEGTNLYYTTGRFDTAFATKTTDNLAVGVTNLYYTSALFTTDFGTKTTTNLAEGTNLYYTSARFDSAFGAKTTTNLTEGTNLYYTSARFDSAFGGKTTTNLSEGTNLYYTDARVESYLTGLGYDPSASTFNTFTINANNEIDFTLDTNDVGIPGTGTVSFGTRTNTTGQKFQFRTEYQYLGMGTENASTAWYFYTPAGKFMFKSNVWVTTDAYFIMDNGTYNGRIWAGAEDVGLTADRTYQLPDQSGTIALTGDLYTTSDFNTDFGTKTTTDLAEGTNLYYTTTRFDTAFGTKTTTDLGEGLNLYYTQSRFNTAFGAKTTTDLAEGTNLYYTTGRFDTALATKTTDNLAVGTTNKYYTSALFSTDFGAKTTSNLAEGSNLYYTNARVTTQVQSLAVSNHSDVTITSIAAGELLKWSGSAWINNTLAEAGIAATSHSHSAPDLSGLSGMDAQLTSAVLMDYLAHESANARWIPCSFMGGNNSSVLTWRVDNNGGDITNLAVAGTIQYFFMFPLPPSDISGHGLYIAGVRWYMGDGSTSDSYINQVNVKGCNTSGTLTTLFTSTANYVTGLYTPTYGTADSASAYKWVLVQFNVIQTTAASSVEFGQVQLLYYYD